MLASLLPDFLTQGQKMTDKSIDELESLKARADKNAHGHILQSLRLKLLDEVATFITTICGAIIMVAGAVMVLSENANSHSIEVTVAVLASFVTLVAIWQAIWQPGPRSKRHQAWATKFIAIENECRLTISGETKVQVGEIMGKMLKIQEQIDFVPSGPWQSVRLKLTDRRQRES